MIIIARLKCLVMAHKWQCHLLYRTYFPGGGYAQSEKRITNMDHWEKACAENRGFIVYRFECRRCGCVKEKEI